MPTITAQKFLPLPLENNSSTNKKARQLPQFVDNSSFYCTYLKCRQMRTIITIFALGAIAVIIGVLFQHGLIHHSANMLRPGIHVNDTIAITLYLMGGTSILASVCLFVKNRYASWKNMQSTVDFERVPT